MLLNYSIFYQNIFINIEIKVLRYSFFYIFVLMESIGEKIKQIRKSKGISQAAIANNSGIKQSSYANIESGKTQNITIETGKGIAKTLGIPFNELFNIEDKNQKAETIQKVLSSLEIAIEFYLSFHEIPSEKTDKKEVEELKKLTLSIEELKSQIHGVLTTFGFCTHEDILTFYKENPEFVLKERKRMSIAKS